MFFWNWFPVLNAKLDRILWILAQLNAEDKAIMSALTDLQASQAALAAAVQAAITDIQSLAAQLAAATAGTPDADVEAVVAQLNALATSLQAAVAPPA
jgi:hypothetical protein